MQYFKIASSNSVTFSKTNGMLQRNASRKFGRTYGCFAHLSQWCEGTRCGEEPTYLY